MKTIGRVVVAAVVVAGLAGVSRLTQGREPMPGQPADKRPAQLVALEEKVKAAIDKVMPAVVAVRPVSSGRGGPEPGYASGVIVSEDGFIVSQYHVSHRIADQQWGASHPKGTRTTVRFADGTEAEAELLGADLFHDLSVLRLTKAGRYPFAQPIGPAPELGDPVLKMGHPQGYVAGRTPPVRLGRVTAAAEPFFVTDCLVTGGDSGGPYFDLDGRLTGIVRDNAVPRSVGDADRAAARRGLMSFSVTPAATVRARWDDLKAGRVWGGTAPGTEEAKRYTAAIGSADALPAGRWSQGEETLKLFGTVVSKGRNLVEVLDGEDRVAYGTPVEADLVLTAASLLPDRPRCRPPGGASSDAEVVGIDPAFDLALVRVKGGSLEPVCWAERPPSVGSLLVAPGPDGPLAAGVIACRRYDSDSAPPKEVTRAGRAAADIPAIVGSRVEGRGFWVEYVGGKAALAGLRLGDVVMSVGGLPVRDSFDLAAAVRSRRAGERVAVAYLRDGKPASATLTLTGQGELYSPRLDGFPTVFEHDLPMVADECGGPVLDLDGRAVGVTVARYSIAGCRAVPADVLLRLLPGLKGGKPLAALPPLPVPKAPGRQAGKPVTVTLDEVKAGLGKRRDALRSVYVEYESLEEVVADRQLAASWGINPLRDQRERHRYAFAGDRRMYAVSRPAFGAYTVPADEVVPAPGAPADVVEEINRRRERAVGAGPYVGAPGGVDEQRWVFDGTDAYATYGDPPAEKIGPRHFFSHPTHLIQVGICPPDPARREAVRRGNERAHWPGNFAGYKTAEVRPRTVPIDGVDCVVVEATTEDGGRLQTQLLWLDPKLGYAPRRWEFREGGLLVARFTNARWEEFAPGCWLPWEETAEIGPPAWVPAEHRDRPVTRTATRLVRAVVNQPRDEWFRP